MMREDLLNDHVVVLPQGLGYVKFREKKTKPGKKCDFGATNKLRRERPDLDNPIVYHLNDARGGFFPYFIWSRHLATFICKKAYCLKPNRAMAREAVRKGKEGYMFTPYNYNTTDE